MNNAGGRGVPETRRTGWQSCVTWLWLAVTGQDWVWLTVTDCDWPTLTETDRDWLWLAKTDRDWLWLANTETDRDWLWQAKTDRDWLWLAKTDRLTVTGQDWPKLTVTGQHWDWLWLAKTDRDWLWLANTDWDWPWLTVTGRDWLWLADWVWLSVTVTDSAEHKTGLSLASTTSDPNILRSDNVRPDTWTVTQQQVVVKLVSSYGSHNVNSHTAASCCQASVVLWQSQREQSHSSKLLSS
jgi:hypothetical protein